MKSSVERLIRLLSLLLSVLTVLAVFTGCHEKKATNEFTVPDTFDENVEYNITFWAKNDTNKNQIAIYDQAVADFEALYPNIHVKIRYYTDYSRIYSDVITNISTGTTPNVCITYPDHIATYMKGTNVVVPLDDLINDEKYGLGGSELRFDGPDKDEMVEKFMTECKINDVQYAMPFMRSTEALYINKTYVEALGYEVPDVVTWDFIWEVCAKAKSLRNEDGTYTVNGQKVLIPFIYKSTDNMMISMLQQLGADYTDAEGDILLFNDTTKDLLLNIDEYAKIGAFSTFKVSGYPANFLNAGQCIFAIDSTAGSTWMGSDAPLVDIAEDELVDFETVVRMIPQYDTENPQMISQGPSICIFNKEDSGEVMASWLFVQFLLSDGVQTTYAETEGYIPVTTKAQNSDAYQEYLSLAGTDNDTHYQIKMDATEMFLEHIDDTFVTPVFNGSASVRTVAGELIESVVKAERKSQTVDSDYIESLYTDLTQRYHLDQYGKVSLGKLPTVSVALLWTLATVWVLIGVYCLVRAIRKKKGTKKN